MAWGKVAPHLVWRPNLGFALWQTGLPKVDMDAAMQDLRLVAENNVIGLYSDKLWEHWAPHGAHYYLLGRMAWNPYADGKAILEDYYRRGFGKAAENVKAYWDLMAATTRKILSARESVRYDPPWWDFYDDSFFEAAQGHLDRAVEAVKDEPEVYRDRIGFVQLCLDHTRSIVEVRELMVRFRESQGKDEEAEDKAREIWVEQIRPRAVSENYPDALNSLFVRPGHGRSLNRLYPKDLHQRW